MLGVAVLCLLWGIAPLLQAGEAGGEENRVSIEKWVYSRERKTITSSNRVIADFTLKNVSGKTLEGTSVEVTLFSALGEKVAGPMRQTLGSIKPQGKAAAHVTANMVPAFGAYEIVVSYQGGKEVWYSNSDTGDPQPKARGLAQNTARVVMVGHEVSQDRANQLSGQVRVRNEGALEAKDVKVQVIYWGADRAGKKVKIGEWTGPLGNGTVPAGKEVTVPLRVPGRVPTAMRTFEIRALCAEASMEAQMSSGEFTDAKELEAAHWTFTRAGEKKQDLEVSCDVRNGLQQDVRDIRLTIEFFANANGKRTRVKSYVHTMPGPVTTGQVESARFTVTGMPPYDGYESSFEYGTAEAKVETPKPAAAPYRHKSAVEVLFKEVTTAEDGTVMAVCSARNGLDHQVKDIVVTFRLLKNDGGVLKQAEKRLEDPLLPGEEGSFVIRIPAGRGFASYDSRVTFVQGGAGAPGSQATPSVAETSAPPPVPAPAPQPKKTAPSATPASEGAPMDLP